MSIEKTLPGLESLPAVLTSTNLLRIFGLWLLYRLSLALYNVSPFHPLYHFPGPKLAAMSFLYECWYDLILIGTYTKKIQKLHDQYGPIVRINPEELHCNDPDFVDEIYAGGARKRDKQAHHMNTIAGPVTTSVFGTVDHETHRIRRTAVNKFFSRAQMVRLEADIRVLVGMLCDKLVRSPGRVFNLASAYSCFTSDVISQYFFGEPIGLLAQPDWEPNFLGPLHGFLNTAIPFRFFPVLRGFVHVMPYIAKYTSGEIALLMNEMVVSTPARIKQVMENRERGIQQDGIFNHLLDSDILPDSEKTMYRLGGEGFSLLSAGTETVAQTLTVITFYLLSQPEVATKLTRELKDNGFHFDNLSWVELEKLKYLNAVINEGLRLSYGESTRTPRIPRGEDLFYRSKDGKYEYVIPRDSAIGISTPIMHHLEDVFPDSYNFLPERWLEEDMQKFRSMERCLLSFNRGSRQCLGMNLALCELYLTTAALALDVLPKLQLYETTLDDIRYDHDLMVPQPRHGSKGVRVMAR